MTPGQLADLRTKIETINFVIIGDRNSISLRYVRQQANELSDLINTIHGATPIETQLLTDIRSFIDSMVDSTRNINQIINPHIGNNIIQRIGSLVNITNHQIEQAYDLVMLLSSCDDLINFINHHTMEQNYSQSELVSFITNLYYEDLKEGYYNNWQLAVINTINSNEFINSFNLSLSYSTSSSHSRLETIVEESNEDEEEKNVSDNLFFNLSLSYSSSRSRLETIVEESNEDEEKKKVSEKEELQDNKDSQNTTAHYLTDLMYYNQDNYKNIFCSNINDKRKLVVYDKKIDPLINDTIINSLLADDLSEMQFVVLMPRELILINLEQIAIMLGITLILEGQ